MAPRRDKLLRGPIPRPKAFSTPSNYPKKQQADMSTSIQTQDASIDPIDVQLLSSRNAEPDPPKDISSFDWDKRLDDKRKYERDRYLRHHHPHHRLSHDIFDNLMLDTSHDMSLGGRNVPTESAPGYKATKLKRETMKPLPALSTTGSQEPAISKQMTDADADREAQIHKDLSASKHAALSQQFINGCLLNRTCTTPTSAAALRSTITSSPHNTPPLHNLHSNANPYPATTTTPHVYPFLLFLFLCILCFFICGWHACNWWCERPSSRRRGGRRHDTSVTTLGHMLSTDLEATGAAGTGAGAVAVVGVSVMEMMDLSPAGDGGGGGGGDNGDDGDEDRGRDRNRYVYRDNDRYRDFPLESSKGPDEKRERESGSWRWKSGAMVVEISVHQEEGKTQTTDTAV